MGIGLYLSGNRTRRGWSRLQGPDAARWADEIHKWIQSTFVDVFVDASSDAKGDGTHLLLFRIHPASEEITLSLRDSGITVDAKTSTLGAGYHIYLCTLLHELAKKFDVSWEKGETGQCDDDDTGYFFIKDASKVHGEMLSWLQATCSRLRELLSDDDKAVAINMPLDVGYQADGIVITPLGPRDSQWLESAVERPESGLDIFPWWETELNERFYLNRALARMWSDIRWRRPLIDAEQTLFDLVASDLETAYRMDPAQSYPWRAWAEVLNYGDVQSALRDTVVSMAADAPISAPIGYRRKPVIAKDLPGHWQIQIPGTFVQDWEDDTWRAWDDTRTIRVSSFSFSGGTMPGDDFFDLGEGETLTRDQGRLKSRAIIAAKEEDGESFWNLQGAVAIPGKACIVTISFQDLVDREWAVQTWESTDSLTGE